MKKLITITATILLLSHFTQTFAQPIYQWRGYNRDGQYNETNLLSQWPEKGPQLLWSFSELGAGYSAPVITPDKIYVNGV